MYVTSTHSHSISDTFRNSSYFSPVLPLETDVTLVRPLPAVYPGVGVEAGGGGEGLPTVLTPVGSVSSVGPSVASQQGGTVEHLLTEITAE